MPLVAEGGGKKTAYHRVNEVMREMQEEGLGMDLFAKKVIAPNDPIAKDLLTHRDGRPGGPPTAFRGSRLGELGIEEAYIYPRSPTPEEVAGIRLWERGRMELRPRVGPAGLCRVVVIDLESEAVADDRRYRDTMANPQPIAPGQLEVTWSEGGAVRIVGPEPHQRWKWSQPQATWDGGKYPPEAIVRAVLAAFG